MGILNVTPDSFSDAGKFFDRQKAIDQALLMAESGADILDIGGESSRPGAEPVDASTEIERVIPVIEAITPKIKLPISVDTTKYEVAETAVKAGAGIINDITGLRADVKLASLAAKTGCHLVLMHMRGTPRTMQTDTHYDNIIGEISTFLKEAAGRAIKAGVAREKIIIDPGIGFGKSAEGNYILLKNLDRFLDLGFPLLVGASRKSFIGRSLNADVDQRLEGSIAAACYAILNGAAIVRVHDVAETKRALTIIQEITSAVRL